MQPEDSEALNSNMNRSECVKRLGQNLKSEVSLLTTSNFIRLVLAVNFTIAMIRLQNTLAAASTHVFISTALLTWGSCTWITHVLFYVH